MGKYKEAVLNKEVVYLEPDEEITSIIDKLKSLQDAKRVFLVTPKSANINQSVVNLKILKKEADKLEKEISLVTSDVVGRNLATQVGIPVYDSIDADRPLVEPVKEEPNLNDVIEIDMTERTPIKPPPGVKVNYYNPDTTKESSQKSFKQHIIKSPVTHSMASPISTEKYDEPQFSRPKTSKKWVLKLIIFLLVVLAGCAIFYFTYPKATVDMVVKSEPVQEKIKITIDTSAQNISDDGKTIPGTNLSVDKDLTKEITATGKKDIGEKATGKVTLSNGSGSAVSLSTGTQLETSTGLVFKTTSDVSVPAATASVDAAGNVAKNPGKVDVSVEAAEAGDKYNITSTSLSVANHSTITAGNSSSFSGGTTRQVTIVSADDIANAQETLTNDLKSTIQTELGNNASGKKLNIIADSIQYTTNSFTTDQKASDEVAKFNATLKARGDVIAFAESDYRSAVIKALGSKIPTDKELVLSTNDEIDQGSFTVDIAKGTMNIDGTIKTKLASKVDDEQIKNSIKGQSLTNAENTLRQNTNLVSSNIKLNVNWLKKLSNNTSKIIISKTYQN